MYRFDGLPAQREIADAMNARLVHRGPDGGDVHVQGPVALAHRRLAIIDPATGRQPLSNEDASLWLVANGEIYNYRELRAELVALGHRFRTNGDCETILHGYAEWGVRVLERLRGMFAFALWDARRNRLFLARDRIGIKPLCYVHTAEGLAFASEIQALHAWPGWPRDIDMACLDQFLHLQYIPAPGSIYRAIRKLEPAHYLLVESGGPAPTPVRYWRFEWAPDEQRSESEWLEALDHGLRDAVSSHLVSDVPFGAFLSGGVDSSTVVAYAARELAEPLRTFTIGFDDPEFDEREPARQFAALAGTRHMEQVVGLDALSLLPKLVHHYGEPFADSSAVCTWRVCEAARREVPMVLSGDGGDEVFAGYSYFPKLVQDYPPLRGHARLLRRALGNLMRRAHLLKAAPDLPAAWHGRSPWFNEDRRAQLWRPPFRGLMRTTRDWNHRQFVAARAFDVLGQCQRVDIENYLPFDNLAKVDIASMAHGLEVRVPLLDHKLLELVARMPASMRLRKLTNGAGSESWCGKYALKKVASRFYPWEAITTPKRGFSVPVGRWLAGEQKTVVRERLLDQASGLDGWFERAEIEALIAEHGVAADHGHRLWALLVLAEWKAQQAT